MPYYSYRWTPHSKSVQSLHTGSHYHSYKKNPLSLGSDFQCRLPVIFFSTATLFSKWQFVTFKRCFLCLVYKSKNKFLEVRVNLWLGMTTPQSLQNYAFFTARWSDDIVAVFDRLFCYYQVFQGFNFVTLIGKNPRNDKKAKFHTL